MDTKATIPLDGVVPFPSRERRQAAATRAAGSQDRWDHGSSPEESLRIRRAFVGIKNRQRRGNLIQTLEGALRTREQASGPNKAKKD